MQPSLQVVNGRDILPYVDDLARLRIEVFREFPYLYDGNMDYERKYLRNYSLSPHSVFVLAQHGKNTIGVATGVPLRDETDAIKRPFAESGPDPDAVFYFGESVLLRRFRGQGIGVKFIQERERYARELGTFTHVAFCAVDRPHNHPRRPPDYVPLDTFWRKRGYEKQPHLHTTFCWQDLDEQTESPKPMTFWLKKLDVVDMPIF